MPIISPANSIRGVAEPKISCSKCFAELTGNIIIGFGTVSQVVVDPCERCANERAKELLEEKEFKDEHNSRTESQS